MCPDRRPRLRFWLALAVALGGALALAAGHDLLGPLITLAAWREALRPVLIAVALVALASAAAVVYGGAPPDGADDQPPPVDLPRVERSALWTVALLWLLSVVLPMRNPGD